MLALIKSLCISYFVKTIKNLYSSSHLSGVHLKFTMTSDRILNLYLMSLRTAISYKR